MEGCRFRRVLAGEKTVDLWFTSLRFRFFWRTFSSCAFQAFDCFYRYVDRWLSIHEFSAVCEQREWFLIRFPLLRIFREWQFFLSFLRSTMHSLFFFLKSFWAYSRCYSLLMRYATCSFALVASRTLCCVWCKQRKTNRDTAHALMMREGSALCQGSCSVSENLSDKSFVSL